MSVTTPAESTHPPARSLPGATPSARWARLRRFAGRSTPGRVRVLAAAAVLVVIALAVAAGMAAGHARTGMRVIGHGAGPQVATTANLYFALSDMDTQLANVLLIGKDHTLGFGRAQALDVYDRDRSTAHQAVEQALALAGGDPDQRSTVRELLDGMGRYERLASRAMLLNDQADHSAGSPPGKVLGMHRKATDMMTLDLLPKAYNLTLGSGSVVRQTYEAEHSATLTGRLWVVLAGVALLVILVGLQLYLAVRFRRLLNPALVLATLGTIAFTVVSFVVLGAGAEHLRTAKHDGFDSILALSRARAVSNTMNADETRYLLDPARADTYDQVYLSKAQSILYTPAGNLRAYYHGVRSGRAAYRADPGDVRFRGFLGEEMRDMSLPGQQAVATRVLTGYQQFQRDDSRVRGLVRGGDRSGALDARLGNTEGATNFDFALFDLSLSSLLDIHQKAFADAVDAGDDALDGWDVLPPAAGVVLVALILIGVRPRLAEYR